MAQVEQLFENAGIVDFSSAFNSDNAAGAKLLVKTPGGYSITTLGDMILANVERIVTDSGYQLTQQIESLRLEKDKVQ